MQILPDKQVNKYITNPLVVSSVQSISPVRLFATQWTGSTPGLPVHHQFLKVDSLGFLYKDYAICTIPSRSFIYNHIHNR